MVDGSREALGLLGTGHKAVPVIFKGGPDDIGDGQGLPQGS